ncbi:unnamed protein product [Moneuplotes crassus]|uniref:Uncharacterized protein n=1 Tax=Euplotes crassus TaxID=5936 RepID=A0AAD1Y064_EUPCR|nr:unnamed protein product [Moneuplotes crassus]
MGCLNFKSNDPDSINPPPKTKEEGKMNLDYYKHKDTTDTSNDLNFHKKKSEQVHQGDKKFKRTMRRVRRERNGSESSYSDLQSEYRSVYSEHGEQSAVKGEIDRINLDISDKSGVDEIKKSQSFHLEAELPKRLDHN